MFTLAEVVLRLMQLLDLILAAYMWCFIISALLTWVQPNPYNPIVRFLRKVTEPVLFRLRRYFKFLWQGGVDFSPMAAILIIYGARLLLRNNLLYLAGLAW